MLVDRELTKLQKENPDLKVIKIDVITNPLAAWKNGIRMIPALKDGHRILSGIFLGGKEIRRFITEAGQH